MDHHWWALMQGPLGQIAFAQESYSDGLTVSASLYSLTPVRVQGFDHHSALRNRPLRPVAPGQFNLGAWVAKLHLLSPWAPIPGVRHMKEPVPPTGLAISVD